MTFISVSLSVERGSNVYFLGFLKELHVIMMVNTHCRAIMYNNHHYYTYVCVCGCMCVRMENPVPWKTRGSGYHPAVPCCQLPLS